jgi:hypothetical protein
VFYLMQFVCHHPAPMLAEIVLPPGWLHPTHHLPEVRDRSPALSAPVRHTTDSLAGVAEQAPLHCLTSVSAASTIARTDDENDTNRGAIKAHDEHIQHNHKSDCSLRIQYEKSQRELRA